MGGWLKMAPSPIGHCVLLLLWGIGLSRRGRSGLCWEGIAVDKILNSRSIKRAEPVLSHSASVLTSVALSAEVELGEVDGGPKLFGVGLLDVLEPRQRRLLWVRHIQVVHG